MTNAAANPSDHDLILEIQAGSLDALGVIYDRHRRLVYRTALAISNDPEAAADLLQDVFLRLFRFANRVDPERPLEPWLYRVTANQSYTWVKRHQRWTQPLEEIAEWLSSGTKNSPQYITEQDDESMMIQRAIGKLSLPQRVVVVMYYINDLSLNEIAEVLDIPEGTVKSRLHYGRNALKTYLGLDGKTSREIQYEFT
ncbi:MAG: sigma-70 family RNA polymerase sigma factor [Chloroflexota bacterium]|nr:MAG: sigma-70 family RNA polymerase sigma factor [Chloroflexota bacterium]